MNWKFNGQSTEVEQSLPSCSPQQIEQIGWFCFYCTDQQ